MKIIEDMNIIQKLQTSIDNLTTSVENLTKLTQVIADTITYVKTCFQDPSILWNQFVGIAPEFFLALFTILIILRFIGFEKVTKWITLSGLIALITAMVGKI